MFGIIVLDYLIPLVGFLLFVRAAKHIYKMKILDTRIEMVEILARSNDRESGMLLESRKKIAGLEDAMISTLMEDNSSILPDLTFFIGGAIGDAIGSYLLHNGCEIEKEHVELALRLSGGGSWGLYSGQITDITEFMIAVGRGLAKCSGDNLDVEYVAAELTSWYRSDPFDMDITVRRALDFVAKSDRNESVADRMVEASKVGSLKSRSSYCLLYAIPVSIWGKSTDLDLFYEQIQALCSLTHPNEVCIYCVCALSILFRSLLFGRGRKDSVDQAIRSLQGRGRVANDIIRLIDEAYTTGSARMKKNHDVMDVLSLVISSLVKEHDFRSIISYSLKSGGQASINAALLGSLFCASHSFIDIPKDMLYKVLKCDTKLGNRPRPRGWSASRIPRIVSDIGTK